MQPEFYDLYINNNDNIIELDEEKKKESSNQLKLEKLNNEINYINFLIKNENEKLLILQNKENDNFINNNGKILNNLYKELLQLNNGKNNNFGLIAAKSEGGIKVELAHVNDPKNVMDQKKSDMNLGKLQYNDEYLNLCSFSNRLYITSNNNNPINLIKIDSKNIKHAKEKEEINNYFQIRNENENVLNNNNNNNDFAYNNNENRCDINFGLFKNNHNDMKLRKDSIVSDYSFYGNLNSFNPEINNIMNNNILEKYC